MRTDLIELVLKVQKMRSKDKLNDLLENETDGDKVSIISHRFAQLHKAPADAPSAQGESQ